MAAADRRRSNFTYATQNKIFDACNAECFYCHKSLVLSNRHKGERGAWNADHLIPAAKGGNNSLENGVAACWNCNSKKSDLSHVEFIAKYGGTLYRCQLFFFNTISWIYFKWQLFCKKDL